MYQDPTLRQGRQRSAITSYSACLAPASSPYTRCIPFLTPRSSTGNTSGRRSANIRYICTVHTPTPFTCVSSAMISSSVIPLCRPNRISPLRVRSARSRTYFTFCVDNPVARNSSSLNCSTARGLKRRTPHAPTKRPKIVPAALPLSC